MVHAGCVFVAFTRLGRMSGFFFFLVRAMECMCAQTGPRFILSSERVLGGMESDPILTPREQSPLQEAQRRVETAMLHHVGQRVQHTTD